MAVKCLKQELVDAKKREATRVLDFKTALRKSQQEHEDLHKGGKVGKVEKSGYRNIVYAT